MPPRIALGLLISLSLAACREPDPPEGPPAPDFGELDGGDESGEAETTDIDLDGLPPSTPTLRLNEVAASPSTSADWLRSRPTTAAP